ncbi:MAG: glycoside hydrolase family protein [Kiritimatiellia bacterium]
MMSTDDNKNKTEEIRPFAERLGRAVRGGGFSMDDYWVWGSSVAGGEDGRYHMFASRWPKTYPFFQGYTAASEIVRASADSPAGPFCFEEVVLGPRHRRYWDGRIAHNPCLYRTDEAWFLFYCGATYEEEASPEAMWKLNRDPDGGKNGRMPSWMHDMQSGVAVAESLRGPWRRPDSPLDLAALSRAGHRRTVNATAMETLEGRCRLYYRITGTGLITAEAPHPAGPYDTGRMRIVSDYSTQSHTEDPYAFRLGNHYEMLSKDSTGDFTGEPFALIHSVSYDGITWRTAAQPRACSRNVKWDDGTTREQGNMERPFVLMEDGKPAWLYAATSDGTHTAHHPAHYNAENTWNMVIPLK